MPDPCRAPLAATVLSFLLAAMGAPGRLVAGEPLPNTKPLTLEGDIASQLVDGVDRFLLKKIDESVAARERHWKRDFSTAEAYAKSVEPNRRRLAHMLGVRDPRAPFDAPETVANVRQSALVGKGDKYEIFAVRWPVLAFPGPSWPGEVSLHGEGLLLVPTDGPAVADMVVIPDADETPEQLAGLAEGVPLGRQYARGLAERGARALVPTIVSREMAQRNGRATLTNREYLYRPAFELGRHMIGYEVQKVLAAVDWFTNEAADKNAKIGVAGYGEGGAIALYAAALDPRIDCVFTSGSFDNRNTIWRQPIDRNVFGLLEEFGDAELLALVFPRSHVIEIGGGPKVSLPGQGGAPAELGPIDPPSARAEYDRFVRLVEPRQFAVEGSNLLAQHDYDRDLHDRLWRLLGYAGAEHRPDELVHNLPQRVGPLPDAAARQARQVAEIDRHSQWLLRESEYVRATFMQRLYAAADTKDVAQYEKVAGEYRDLFRHQVIGAFDDPLLPPSPRSRQAYDTPKWTGYEVVLDVWPDVIAYGILLVPKDIAAGERRPVVVCQHGLEGRPQDIVAGDHPAYHDFAARLAERGFVTFAPQNLYIFTDRFRSLQRKANPLGKTLFSIIVPQHQQITDWLGTLPFVDPERIGFYGLSYGGKSAMRIPALVSNYCLSICSADFNEWVWKNASTRSPYSYVWTGEYEIFEFDLGSTFNYAEMAALIAPRPFMVERGHFDGVAPDELVAYEFAKVRHLYAARLGLPDRCQMETFVGPHTINGVGTFEFLHRHLRWPQK